MASVPDSGDQIKVRGLISGLVEDGVVHRDLRAWEPLGNGSDMQSEREQSLSRVKQSIKCVKRTLFDFVALGKPGLCSPNPDPFAFPAPPRTALIASYGPL
jgi:hypothetical protein